jgi:hypothetical protein
MEGRCRKLSKLRLPRQNHKILSEKRTKAKRARGMGQVAAHLASKPKVLSSTPHIAKKMKNQQKFSNCVRVLCSWKSQKTLAPARVCSEQDWGSQGEKALEKLTTLGGLGSLWQN